MENQSDEIVMQQVAQGNLDILTILFDRHHKHVYNFLYKMSRDKMLSEDLTQEVFLKLIRHRTTYKNGSFVSWLFTIARNSLKTHYSRQHKHHADIDEVHTHLAETANNTQEDYSHLQNALNQLSLEERELVILNRYQEIRYEELAQIVGSTPGAVKTKVCRVLKKLKTIYLESI
ncbi:MAG: RNA polymerase sigma factor [Bacteroidota bacterium]